MMPLKTGLLSLTLLLPLAAFGQSTPKLFPPPGRTAWVPSGCRTVPPSNDRFLSREGFRNLHSDALATDEISRALAPMIREAWTAETATYNPTGPVFDRAGNVYFSPLAPFEDVVLISLDPSDGSRRWAIAGGGARPGGSTPMVLADPLGGGDVVYLVVYDRALAVRDDGTIVWDVATGLDATGLSVFDTFVLGTNYVPQLDAIVAATLDGYVLLFDRLTGAPLMSAPHQLPGLRSPDPPPSLPQGIRDAADAELRTLVDLPPGAMDQFTDVILGNNVEVANHLSVDPATGRLWVAATAPDAEDGTVDGLSSLGALYGLDVVLTGGGYQVVEACHRSFVGGSATTPALRTDGTRVYVGDNAGKLLALARDCSLLWEVDLGSQIYGSIAVASDKAEIYASTQEGIAKVIDADTSGTFVWLADLDVFNLASGARNLNLNLVAIGANGLGFQAGAGAILNGVALPNPVGAGVLDRETGAVRYFVGGGEETVAAINTGPDGSMYLGNSPVRRIFARVIGTSTRPLLGGITKFAAERHDLLMRDAACAAEARAANAYANQALCPESARADARQIRELIAQVRENADGALAEDRIGPLRWRRLDRRLVRADERIAAAEPLIPADRGLRRAASILRLVCKLLDAWSS
jgi:outer membrane protein assembly factor BamB